QRRLADQVVDLKTRRGRDLAAVGLLDLGVAARYEHVGAVTLRSVVGDLRVPVRAPVAVVAKSLARARADHERARGLLEHRRNRRDVGRADWDVPARILRARHADELRKLEQTIHDVTLRPRR